jgi:hypothetical protein
VSVAAERINEALALFRRCQHTPQEAAAMAYLRAQVEQAKQQLRLGDGPTADNSGAVRRTTTIEEQKGKAT